jgi:hypothetical protein
VIGKSGATIKNIRGRSKCKILISEKVQSPLCVCGGDDVDENENETDDDDDDDDGNDDDCR